MRVEEPVMVAVQVVVALVATTVYTPATVFAPKLRAAPVPGRGEPSLEAPIFN